MGEGSLINILGRIGTWVLDPGRDLWVHKKTKYFVCTKIPITFLSDRDGFLGWRLLDAGQTVRAQNDMHILMLEEL